MTAFPAPRRPNGAKYHGVRKSLVRLLSLLLLMIVAYVGASGWLFLRSYDLLRDAVANGKMPSAYYGPKPIHWAIDVSRSGKEGGKPTKGTLAITEAPGRAHIRFQVEGKKETPLLLWKDEAGMVLHAANSGATFRATNADSAPVREALAEAAALLPELTFKQKLGVIALARPRLTGVFTASGEEPCLNFKTSMGFLQAYLNGTPRLGRLRYKGWDVEIGVKPIYAGGDFPADIPAEAIPGDELMLSLAEAIRIGAYHFTPLTRPTDGVNHSGKGWMKVQDGHRQMYLSGTPYEIGFQHGDLAGPGVGRMARRLVYGVGLLYSIKQKEWFPTAAKKLVERQRPFIHADYFEEMRGLAAGTGLPLDLIQMVNIFPEFFHCSGVAVMGDATKGGSLLHARVLDYMVGVGLQDDAAVMAIERTGKHRFVTIGYLGFIGSVTGMNEHQVAIGEMGGAGQGDWDGIPMSLLIRQSLEDFDTLEGVEKFMRDSPRTCEYYYLLSDGKGPKAMGVAATPEKFETFGPGAFHERLQQPVNDSVLLSGPGRYEKLVERVKADYGTIDRDQLIEIIKRPVSMQSNLHNVIFEPQALRLVVADASRSGPACNEPYRLYTWDALFPSASSPSVSAR